MKRRALTRLAWQGLTQHKLRSILSALGIVFGVGAVIAMLSVSEGARREILAEVGRLGITRVSVRAGALSQETELDARTLQSPGLTVADARAIAEVCPTVASLAPLRERSEQIMRDQHRTEASIIATTPLNDTESDARIAYNWDTAPSTVSSGTHTVAVRVTDTSGNTTTDSVRVTVVKLQ